MSTKEGKKKAAAASKVAAGGEEGAEMKRLRAENAKLQGALDAIMNQMGTKHTYYDYLVWRARKTDDTYVPAALERVKKSLKNERMYQQLLRDEESLSSPEAGDWHHGFNSGCLAMSRLVMELSVMNDEVWDDGGDEPFTRTVEAQRNDAIAEFPNLDT